MNARRRPSQRVGGQATAGSSFYMPPEQGIGDAKAIGPYSDIDSLGAIHYELLTGRPQFRSETILQTIQQVSEHPPVSPAALQPGVPRDLEVICLKWSA